MLHSYSGGQNRQRHLRQCQERAYVAQPAAFTAGRPKGVQPLRSATAGHTASACVADDMVVCNGAQQALDLIARLLIEPERDGLILGVGAVETLDIDPALDRLRDILEQIA